MPRHREPSGLKCRQNKRKATVGLLGLFWVLGITPLLAQTTPDTQHPTPAPLELAEAAIVQLAQGDYPGAAQKAGMALQSAPSEATLFVIAGTLLLNTGDAMGATTAFENAVAYDKEDSLAFYGLGLAQLARGKRAEALASWDTSERLEGDKSYLLLARRYAQWLNGAQISLENAGLPETFRPAQLALEGMAAARQGDWKRAKSLLEAAQTALPGDPILQPGGLLMRFDKANPITTTANRLLNGQGLKVSLPKERALSGNILFAPDNISPDVVYVSYEMDGQSLCLLNVHPYHFAWDSRQATNGVHTLTILLSDRNGRDLRRITRQLRLFNPGKSVFATGNPERVMQLRAALWQALTLRPDRGSCAFQIGVACHASGEGQAARHWLLRAVAIRPDNLEARRHWIACGGLAEGSEAVWGGLTTERLVALTFDDGPKPGITEPLLEILTEQKVPSTFFVIGRHVTAYPALTRRIVEAGMELANHSYTHRNLTKLSEEAIAQEMLQTQAAVQAVTGRTPRFMRPPGGNWNDSVAKVVKYWGLTPCFWTVDVYGSEVVGAQAVANEVLSRVHPGSIILMHNGKMSTLQALPTILRELKARGYSFVTVDTLVRRMAVAHTSRNAVVGSVTSKARRTE